MRLADRYELAVVGAGPAGLAAAEQAGRLGVATVLLDEQVAPGGQIYRGITTTPLTRREVLGHDYWRGAELIRAFEASGATYAPGSTVWAVTGQPDGALEIGLSHAGAARLLQVRHLILATGAQERPFPIPGWTLPGVITAGAAQILLKTAGLVPSARTVLAGTGPLLYLLAAQLAAVGAPVYRLLDTTPRSNLSAARTHALDFLRSPYLLKGLSILRAAQASTRIVCRVDAIEALGANRLERVAYSVAERREEVDADLLLLHQGVVPNINLSNAIGCRQHWDATQLAFVPTVDAWGASSMSGVTIAGDGAGIAGARAAQARGTLAALHAATALNRLTTAQRDQHAAAARADLTRWTRGRNFIDLRYRPPEQFRVPRGNTLVCRCEEISAQQVVDTVKLGCTGPNQMKSFLRCGMGPCQGRFCGLTVTEIIAKERGVAPADVGYYRLRFPIKPITLGELAELPQTDASEQAVVRISDQGD